MQYICHLVSQGGAQCISAHYEQGQHPDNASYQDSGPEVIMAGKHNHRMVTLAAGFKSHLPGWPEHVVKFYCNERKPF